MKKILVTGGGGRFSKILKSIKTKHQFIYTDKKKLNITKINSIKKILISLNQITFYILPVYQDL